MQTQDAPAEILFKLWPWLEANKNRIIGAVAALVILVAVYYFISARQEQKEVEAGEAMTQLLSTPTSTVGQAGDQLVALAAKYPGTEAAQRAQVQGAAAMFAAGRFPEAQTQFQKLLESTTAGPLAATATLGVAASLEAQGKSDQAAPAYQKVISSFPGSACAVQAYASLGRIAEQKGDLNEALNNYESAARAGQTGGSIAQVAAFNAAQIKAKLAATTPKVPVTPAVSTAPAAPAKTSPAPTMPTFVVPSK